MVFNCNINAFSNLTSIIYLYNENMNLEMTIKKLGPAYKFRVGRATGNEHIFLFGLRITDEGSLPEMRIWSILLINSYLKWCIHLSRSLCIFQLLDECHCWWTRESPRAHVAMFCGQLRLIRSVLRESKFSVLKLIEIVILWDYYTSPFGFGLFRHFWV